MMPKALFKMLVCMVLSLSNGFAQAQSSASSPETFPGAAGKDLTSAPFQTINTFTAGSYRQILANNVLKPFILSVWSIDCPSCIKDMALLKQIHGHWPGLKIILLSVDDFSSVGQIQKILQQMQLSDLENWIFEEQNSRKLRFELDPKWYGEMPRTYFFDASHQRIGISGVLSKKDYEAGIEKILNRTNN